MAKFDHQYLIDCVDAIRAQQPRLDAESKRLRTQEILDSFNPLNAECWCLAALGDSLIKLRLFTEQNFNFIETMGTIAVARYIFELSVWALLFERDCRYGLVYGLQLHEVNKRYWADYCEHALREIDLLMELEEVEKEIQEGVIAKYSSRNLAEQDVEAFASEVKFAMERVDALAARRFSIYAEQAKTNGYGFQAHLVKTEIVPEIQSNLAAVKAEQFKMQGAIGKQVKDIATTRWNWRQMSAKVGMSNEYDFIYTFSSKLLHATPASLTTDQKNLEPEELYVFLNYIRIKIADILDLAKKYPKKWSS